MIVEVNGETCAFEDEALTILELLRLRDVKTPDMVSVQLNGRFVNRESFDASLLKQNDRVDYLYFMSGGAIGSVGTGNGSLER